MDNDRFLLEILRQGEAYTEIQSQVGGDDVDVVVRKSFLSFDTIDTEKLPPARSRLAKAVVDYAKHVHLQGGGVSEDHIDKLLYDFRNRFDEAATKANEAPLEEEEITRPLTQKEKNQLLAKEVLDQRRQDRLMFDRGDFTMDNAEREAAKKFDDEVVRCGEEVFLSDATTILDVKRRMDSATKARDIASRRMHIGDYRGGCKAFRFALKMLNFHTRTDISYFLSVQTAKIDSFLDTNMEACHANLAACLIEMAANETKVSQRMFLAAEAASQASGAIELNRDNVRAIYLRGRARVLAEDFEAGRIDLKEAQRRNPMDPKIKDALQALGVLKKEAHDREKKLWGGKLNQKKLSAQGFTFMGNTARWWEVVVDKIYEWMSHNPMQVVSIFLILCAIVISIPQNFEYAVSKQRERENNKLELELKKRGLWHMYQEYKEHMKEQIEKMKASADDTMDVNSNWAGVMLPEEREVKAAVEDVEDALREAESEL